MSESTTGVTHAAEASSVVATKEERDVPLPEDLGKRAARLLLDEIAMVRTLIRACLMYS